MHPADREVWMAIDRGDRELEWEAWFGDPEAADYLTAPGKAIRRRAAADLTDFFGRSWLPRATRPGATNRVNELGAASPVLSLAPARRPHAFIEALRWWASLRLLVERDVDGIGMVRRAARNDISTDRFRHTLAQARLGVLGLHMGADVVLEPAKVAGPGDVLIRHGNRDVFIEVVTFGAIAKDDELYYDRHWQHLISHERDEVYWDGDVPGFLNKSDDEAWYAKVNDAAARCRASVALVVVAGPWGELTAKPGRAPESRTFHGPSVVEDLGTLLSRVIDRKAAQTRDAGIAWIWIEDYGGMHPMTPFASMSLPAKVSALTGLAAPVFAERSHLAGVAWSRTTRSEGAADEAVDHPAGAAIQRRLPGGLVRQTIVLHRRLLLPDQLRILVALCTREPDWLDWALEELGTGPVADLVAKGLT